MRQYYRFKSEHPGCLLLFRMGDFYELFDEDAVTAHQALGITLTERTKGVPMAGVPHHAVESYLRRLINKGFRVAVCEQMQDPREAKGVVDRAVTRVLSPGTLVDESLLEEGVANLAAALLPVDAGATLHGKAPSPERRTDGPGDGTSNIEPVVAVALAELSTGDFSLRLVAASHLAAELARLAPREALIPDTLDEAQRLRLREVARSTGAAVTERPGWHFRAVDADELLRRHYGVARLDAFGIADQPALIAVAGALLAFLLETHGRITSETPGGRPLSHLRPPSIERSDARLEIDAATLRSLEIERTSRHGHEEGSLLSALERPATPMGRRLMRKWLAFPLAERNEIEARHAQVEALVADAALRSSLRRVCSGVQDLARISSRAALGRATPRDLVALGRSAAALDAMRGLLEGSAAFAGAIDALRASAIETEPLGQRLRAECVDEPPSHLRDGGLFRDGVDPELDEARGLQRDADAWLASYQGRLVRSSGIASLKVGFNRVFGYYIEITNAHRSRIPEGFIRTQTLKGAERYTTPELRDFQSRVESAERRALDRERALFDSLCREIARSIDAWRRSGEAVASIDVLAAFAETAARRRWCRPVLADAPVLLLRDARHPVLEALLEDRFVPNDCELGTAAQPCRTALITGPNMAGKSTFIRQNALIVLLAQAGSFVPAREATVGVADRLLARIGSADELHEGQSTFMVEMVETASILHHATERSVVILDEIGRGTSTLDGLSLAWAIAEALAARRCRTLFATHYHELTELADRVEGVINLHVRVREWQEQIVFLHRIEPGRSDRSYGLHVARLAGVPRETVARAKEVLENLSVQHAAPAPPPGRAPAQLSLFTEYLPHPVVKALQDLDLDRLTPLEAFDLLRRLREQARR